MKGPAAMLDGLTISKYNLLAKNSSLSIDKNMSVQKREHLSVDKGNIEIFEDVLSTQKMVTSSESAAAVGGFSGCCGLCCGPALVHQHQCTIDGSIQLNVMWFY